MGARGKQSGASLAVVGTHGITAVDRPGPPDELTREQSEEWVKVVNAMPAEWFSDETHASLIQYCRHVTESRWIARQIDELKREDDFDWAQYNELCKMQQRETSSIERVKRGMRLTHQSKYSKEKKRGTPKKKPWD